MTLKLFENVPFELTWYTGHATLMFDEMSVTQERIRMLIDVWFAFAEIHLTHELVTELLRHYYVHVRKNIPSK